MSFYARHHHKSHTNARFSSTPPSTTRLPSVANTTNPAGDREPLLNSQSTSNDPQHPNTTTNNNTPATDATTTEKTTTEEPVKNVPYTSPYFTPNLILLIVLISLFIIGAGIFIGLVYILGLWWASSSSTTPITTISLGGGNHLSGSPSSSSVDPFSSTIGTSTPIVLGGASSSSSSNNNLLIPTPTSSTPISLSSSPSPPPAAPTSSLVIPPSSSLPLPPSSSSSSLPVQAQPPSSSSSSLVPITPPYASWDASSGVSGTGWTDSISSLSLFNGLGYPPPTTYYNGQFKYLHLTGTALTKAALKTMINATFILVYQYQYYTNYHDYGGDIYQGQTLSLWNSFLYLSLSPYAFLPSFIISLSSSVYHFTNMNTQFHIHDWHVLVIMCQSAIACTVTIDNRVVLNSPVAESLPTGVSSNGIMLFHHDDIVNIKSFDIYDYDLTSDTIGRISSSILSTIYAPVTLHCSYLTNNFTFVNYVLSLQPTFYWVLNDTFGSITIKDYSSNQFNGTYTNPGYITYCDITLTPSNNISSVSFPAALLGEIFDTSTNQVVSIDITAGLYSTVAIPFIPAAETIAFMFRTNHAGTVQTLFTYKFINQNADRTITMNETGYISAYMYYFGDAYLTTTISYNDNLNHFLVMTLSSLGFYLYMDGSLVAANPTVTSGSGYPFGGTPNIWAAGAGSSVAPSYYSGAMGHIMYWNTVAHSAGTIQNMYYRK